MEKKQQKSCFVGKNYHQTFHTKIKNLHSGEVTLTFFLQADFSCSLFSNVLGKQNSCKATFINNPSLWGSIKILHSGKDAGCNQT